MKILKVLVLSVVVLIVLAGMSYAQLYSNDQDALFGAAVGGDLAEVQARLAKGVNVNVTQDINGATPLMVASKYGHLAVVKYLLTKGANVNTTDNYGKTALWRAVKYNHPDVANVLRQAGARE